MNHIYEKFIKKAANGELEKQFGISYNPSELSLDKELDQYATTKPLCEVSLRFRKSQMVRILEYLKNGIKSKTEHLSNVQETRDGLVDKYYGQVLNLEEKLFSDNPKSKLVKTTNTISREDLTSACFAGSILGISKKENELVMKAQSKNLDVLKLLNASMELNLCICEHRRLLDELGEVHDEYDKTMKLYREYSQKLDIYLRIFRLESRQRKALVDYLETKWENNRRPELYKKYKMIADMVDIINKKDLVL